MSRSDQQSNAGFTLLELLLVIVIMAFAVSGVSFAMRDTTQTALARDAERLAALFESARAQSRASGVAVVWRITAEGFRFEGLPEGALPQNWLLAGISASSSGTGTGKSTFALQLGPEPIIGPQSVDLMYQGSIWRVSTDGLRPFFARAAGQQ